MVRLISRQRGGLAALKLTKLFGITDFPASKDSGKVLIIIIYCYLIIIIIISISRTLKIYESPTDISSYDPHQSSAILKCVYRSCKRHQNIKFILNFLLLVQIDMLFRLKF